MQETKETVMEETIMKELRKGVRRGFRVNNYHLTILDQEWYGKIKTNGEWQYSIIVSLGCYHLKEILQAVRIMENNPFIISLTILALDLQRSVEKGKDLFYNFILHKDEPSCIDVEQVGEDGTELIGHLTVEIQKVLVSPESSVRTDIAIKNLKREEEQEIFMQTLKDLQTENNIVPVATLFKILKDKLNLSVKEIESLMGQLLREGVIYQPRKLHLRIT